MNRHFFCTRFTFWLSLFKFKFVVNVCKYAICVQWQVLTESFRLLDTFCFFNVLIDLYIPKHMQVYRSFCAPSIDTPPVYLCVYLCVYLYVYLCAFAPFLNSILSCASNNVWGGGDNSGGCKDAREGVLTDTDLSPPGGRCLTVNDFKLTLGSVAGRRSNRITPAVIVTDRSPTLMLLAMVLLIAHDMKSHLSKTLDVQVFYKL